MLVITFLSNTFFKILWNVLLFKLVCWNTLDISIRFWIPDFQRPVRSLDLCASLHFFHSNFFQRQTISFPHVLCVSYMSLSITFSCLCISLFFYPLSFFSSSYPSHPWPDWLQSGPRRLQLLPWLSVCRTPVWRLLRQSQKARSRTQSRGPTPCLLDWERTSA